MNTCEILNPNRIFVVFENFERKSKGYPSQCPRVSRNLGGMKAFKVGEGRVLSENFAAFCRLPPWRSETSKISSLGIHVD